MPKNLENIRQNWRRVKNSSQFRNVMMFLIFVVIATIFWFIIALNDNVSETFRVGLRITNIPDSVTFITDPPVEIHVTLRDKGTKILRSGAVKNPTINIDFAEYARDGVLRLTSSDLMSQLKSDFGGMAQITSASIDSLRCYYTTSPGKRVPVIVRSDVSAASGFVVTGEPEPAVKSVLIYSYGDETDTVHQVYTQRLVKKDLSQTSTFPVKIVQIAGIKIVPPSVEVTVNVEALVHKEAYIAVDPLNIPEGESLLLFPPKVPVSFYVPMSKFNDENPSIHVVADYNDIRETKSSMIPVRITASSANLVNVKLMADSVEYTLIKQ